MKNELVSLYIVKEGDSIESICEKFNISKDILLRYNPILKNVHIHEGQPLNIVMYEEREKKKKDISEIPKSPTEQEFNKILRDIAFYLKEGIASNVYYEQNLEPVVNELERLYATLAKLFTNLSSPKEKEQFIAFLKEMEKQYFDVIEILKKKNPEEIKKYENNIKITSEEFVQFVASLEESLMNPSIIDSFRRLIDLFNLLALKLLTFKFSSAQRIFKEILSQMESFSKLVDFTKK